MNNNFDFMQLGRYQLRFCFLVKENKWCVALSDVEDITRSKLPEGAEVLNSLIPSGQYTYLPCQLISVSDAIQFNRNSNNPNNNLALLLEDRLKYPVPKMAA
jgi:hypothetical protein